MARYGGRTGLHRVAAATVLTASLIAPAAISAQEAEQPPSQPAPVGEPSAEPAPPPAPPGSPAAVAPEPAAPPAAAPPEPTAAPATAVTVSRASASASKAVSIVNFAYSPDAITVSAGDSVTWTNKDAAPEGHDVKGDSLDSGTLGQDASFSFTFEEAGSYSYICSIHPSMTGTVEVLARAGGGDDSASGGGSSSGTAPADAVTESDAISSPDAAGTAVTLPASGEPVAGLIVASLLLIGLGVAFRALHALRARG